MPGSIHVGGTKDPPEKSASINQMEHRNTFDTSIWNIPGIDKDTFYAAALYLYASAGQLEGRAWSRGPKTPQATRDFLDCLADCFARSKLRDAGDHVSATTMVRDDQQRKITLYIAKNRSSKGSGPLISKEQHSIAENENEVFAKQLVQWFNSLTGKAETTETEYGGLPEHSEVFTIMCKFSQSRLEHYIAKISELDPVALERALPLELEEKCQEGWKAVKSVLDKCRQHQNEEPKTSSKDQVFRSLMDCAIVAGKTRKSEGFRCLAGRVEASALDSKLKLLTKAMEGVKYLGRIYAAYIVFSRFCRDGGQREYSFEYVLLPSKVYEWNGSSYLGKILSWTGDLSLDDINIVKIGDGRSVAMEMTLRDQLKEYVRESGETAPVHCEVQLLMHFLRNDAPACVDYFGCSKKSCWLCWHMMVQNHKFSMKDTHRKLYPRWALPSELTLSYTNAAEAFKIAYNEMLSLLQHKVIQGEGPKPLPPFLQSSARMTPHNWDLETGLAKYLSEHIEARCKDKLPIDRVPALYIPSNGSFSDIRGVTVSVYEKPKQSEASPYINMVNQKFGIQDTVLAFQLLTLPESWSEDLEISEYQRAIWRLEEFPAKMNLSPPHDRYLMYYRRAETHLAPNPCILETWRREHGDVYGYFPWQGDIFIIHIPYTYPKASNLKKARIVDKSKAFEALENYFKHFGPRHIEHMRDRYESLVDNGFKSLRRQQKWDKSTSYQINGAIGKQISGGMGDYPIVAHHRDNMRDRERC